MSIPSAQQITKHMSEHDTFAKLAHFLHSSPFDATYFSSKTPAVRSAGMSNDTLTTLIITISHSGVDKKLQTVNECIGKDRSKI